MPLSAAARVATFFPFIYTIFPGIVSVGGIRRLKKDYALKQDFVLKAGPKSPVLAQSKDGTGMNDA